MTKEDIIILPQPTLAEAFEGPNALKEAAALAADVDLFDRQKINEFNSLSRVDRKEDHIHRLIVCGLYVVAGCCLIMFLVLVSQYV